MQLLQDRYEILSKIGQGAAGAVYRGRDRLHPETDIAIKVFLPEIEAAAVLCEFNALASLYHPNIVDYRDCGVAEDGTSYLITEYIDGSDFLSAVLKKPFKEQVTQLATLALALDFIHGRGLLHGDLKPSNILIETKNTTLKLVDFGMAMPISPREIKKLPNGTLAYLSPERLKEQKCDGRSDLYALGLIAFELFYQTLPFEPSDPDAIVRFHLYDTILFPEKPKQADFIQGLIATCLHKDPRKRFGRGLDIAKWLCNHAKLSLDLSPYGLLSGTIQHDLIASIHSFFDSVETELKKAYGPLSRTQLAEQLRRLGRYEDALHHLKRSSKEERRLRDHARRIRGRIFLEKGDYEAVLGIKPETPDDWNTRGLAHFYLTHYREAEACFHKVFKRPSSAYQKGSAWNYLGMTAYNSGNLENAESAYRKALSYFESGTHEHGLVSVFMNLGALYQHSEHYQEALAAYEKSLTLARRIDHHFLVATLLNNLANLYLRFGADEEAASFLVESRKRSQDANMPFLDGYNLLIEGDLFMVSRDFTKSKACYLTALAHFESLGMAREQKIAKHNLFELAILAEDMRTAKRYAATSLEQAIVGLYGGQGSCVKEKKDVEFLYAQAAFYEKRGDLGAASQAIDRILENFARVKEMIPFDYRNSFEKHPNWARALAWKADHIEEDPVKLADFQKLLEVNKRLNTEHTLDKLLAFIMDTVIEITHAERGFLILEKRIMVARNIDQEIIQKPSGKVSKTVIDHAEKTGKSILTSDAGADPRLKTAKSVQAMKLTSILCAPLLHRNRSIGAIYVENRFQKGVFTEADLEIFSAFADQAVIAIQNARLYEENKAHSENISGLNKKLESLVARQTVKLDEVTEALKKKQRTLERRYTYDAIIGDSAAMEKVFAVLDRITDRDISVLVSGESGTGKELIARALHYNSPRRDKEFVAINCAAIPAHLLESELFGYVRGAFTGAAQDKKGLFETAEGGTLFLDEIGDMPIEMQSKLLRALESREIRRVGSHRLIPINVRLVSASNKPLLGLAKKKQFREDLYYRLNAVELHLPPLRERREDIPLLAEFLLKELSPEHPKKLSPRTLSLLMAYDWPGNIRELKNELERANTLSDETIDIDSLSEKLLGLPQAESERNTGGIRATRQQLERSLIIKALKEMEGNKSRAAASLGISRVALYQKIKKLEIRV